MSETRSYKRMPNVNIPETEKVKLVWTHQEKRRRQHLKNDEYGCAGEEKKGQPTQRWIDNTRKDMTNMN